MFIDLQVSDTTVFCFVQEIVLKVFVFVNVVSFVVWDPICVLFDTVGKMVGRLVPVDADRSTTMCSWGCSHLVLKQRIRFW